VVEGVGILATDCGERVIRGGDWVRVPAGQWHWHGASADHAMVHVSIKPFGPTDWTAERRDWETYEVGAQ
jgi:quercetin dioxygenase-like cupin family protein